ncbi:MAG TPA: FtsX-like permease family protein, partial [Cyclobacteriaceae bacterium]|nr:FtsX-like permease family protein [Cyclobacteriaceae bacterium]
GLRKVVGAIRGQLITQYLSESVLITLLAMVLSLAFAFMGLEWLNSFTQKELALHLFQQPLLLAGLITASVAIGLLAGIYPAFIVSGYRPALTLKGQQGSARGKGAIRKVLVVSQFSISVALLIATAITIQQLSYLNSKDLGFDKDQVVTLSYFSELQPNYDAFYNELMRSSGIKNAGRSSRIPTGRLLDSQGAPRIAMGDSLVNTEITTKNVRVDESFFPTYNIPFVAGRNFSKSIGTDDSLAFIVNETAAKAYGLATPEEGINRDFSYGGVTGKLIGVVKDFHFESLHQGIIPIVFHQGGFNTISVKIAGNNLQEGLQQIEKVWREFLPNRPFEYQFLDQRYQQLYEAEQDQSHLFTIFSGLAIFIACLGLFGLATFNTLQRVKEIGIRKVLGASVASILRLLSKEIVVLILVANLIAWPVAWYFMNKWLDTFAYHVDMGLLVYLLAGAVAVLVALVTVSSQTIKAAMTNPSNTLRYE